MHLLGTTFRGGLIHDCYSSGYLGHLGSVCVLSQKILRCLRANGNEGTCQLVQQCDLLMVPYVTEEHMSSLDTHITLVRSYIYCWFGSFVGFDGKNKNMEYHQTYILIGSSIPKFILQSD